MAVLPRLALEDIIDTALCERDSPKTDIADAANDMFVGVLSANDAPSSAPAALGSQGHWTQEELERLYAWANMSPPLAPADANSAAETEHETPQVLSANMGQPQPVTPAAATPTPFQFPPPPQNNNATQHINATVPQAPKILFPTPFNFPPPPPPEHPTMAPGQLPKKVLTVAGTSKKAHIVHPSPRHTSKKDKTLVSYDIAESLHRQSISMDPNNTICAFTNCLHPSPNPRAHYKHMMTHVMARFRCEWCGNLYKRVDTLNEHIAECKARLEAASEAKSEVQ